MSRRYFKLLATFEGMEEWVVEEFLAGRARYGWSPPGADLRAEHWPDEIMWAWRPSKFLLHRIEVGDRVVVQTSQPLREFLVGEVIAPGYSFDAGGEQYDFNHILHVRPLVPQPVPINSSVVPEFLKHDLSKRGRYYEIYPERSLQALDKLVALASAPGQDLSTTRSKRAAFDEAAEEAKNTLAAVISRTWPAKFFEAFCEDLLKGLPYVEVKERSDTFKGWDMLVRFINPITDEVLVEEVPVQCKNYEGPVTTDEPINDLERCVRNSETNRAMLLIMGELTGDFQQRVLERAAALSEELGREIVFEVVDDSRIAEMYATSLTARRAGEDVVDLVEGGLAASA